MQRRDFLGWMTVGAASAALPRLVFARTDDKASADVHEDAILVAALKNAKDHGKPLLVLVVPEKNADRGTRGDAFGAWFNEADEAMLADLAMVEVVCASLAALRKAAIGDLDANAWMFLVDVHDDAPTAQAISLVLPAWPPVPSGPPTSKRISDHRRETVRVIHDRFRIALKVGTRLESLATTAEASLDAKLRERIVKAIDGPATLAVGEVDRAAAFVRAMARGNKPREDAAQRALAAAAEQRLRKASPAGAQWARQQACGIEIEGTPYRSLGPCGMAAVSDDGDRFLRFLTQTGK